MRSEAFLDLDSRLPCSITACGNALEIERARNEEGTDTVRKGIVVADAGSAELHRKYGERTERTGEELAKRLYI